jgi:hypothetical protein
MMLDSNCAKALSVMLELFGVSFNTSINATFSTTIVNNSPDSGRIIENEFTGRICFTSGADSTEIRYRKTPSHGGTTTISGCRRLDQF